MQARNHYCANCLMTRRFHDAKDHMECECCRRVLVKTPLRVAGRS